MRLKLGTFFRSEILQSFLKEKTPLKPWKNVEQFRTDPLSYHVRPKMQKCSPLFKTYQQVLSRQFSKFVDRQGNVHFKKRGLEAWIPPPERGYHQFDDRQRLVVALAIVVGGGSFYVYYSNLQTVPYTYRRHSIPFSPAYEKGLGEEQFQQIKKDSISLILPAHYPEAQRVKRIATDIIQNLYSNNATYDAYPGKAKTKITYTDTKNVSKVSNVEESNGEERENLLEGKLKGLVGKDSVESWGSGSLEEEDKWIEENRRTHRPEKGFTKHLENLNWEVVVIQKPIVNAFCLPGGKIVVFTGLLQTVDSDAELASVLGHEVGHVVARHGMERMTAGYFLMLLQVILSQFIDFPNLLGTAAQFLFLNPFSRKHEIEADRIGLILMASAGFDPREAPNMFAKLDEKSGNNEWVQYVSTHPSGKRRAKLLSEASTMGEAVKIYEQKMRGNEEIKWFSQQ